ncbi:MAG: hydrogenase expression/formation protein HypE [Anaerolineales bacterium]|nr:hydrogenase expression/formation protein HypE [Anaerolineales bacterium]
MSNPPNFESFSCPTPLHPGERIVLGHGSGGRLSRDLLERVILPALGDTAPRSLDDSAVVELAAGRAAFTTDSHVVRPLEFPGGDIGRLAVCGSVNDLAMVGAEPIALSLGCILEEGFPLETLSRILSSARDAAHEAGVFFAAGDTKVVERGKADGLFLNTSGVGRLPPGVRISGAGAKPGDVVILSGTIGDHGIAVLSAREGLGFETDLKSDLAPLNGLVAAMLAAGDVHVLRDPTRGGLATTLVEIASQSGVGIDLEEGTIPLHGPVRAACEMLGFDPLYVANEGKLAACVAESDAEKILAAMRAHPYGAEAAIIGRVREDPRHRVRLRTAIGGKRILDMLPGEMLPRIC